MKEMIKISKSIIMKNIYIIACLIFVLVSNRGYSQRIWGSPLGQYAYNAGGGAMNNLSEISSSYYNSFASANNNPMGYLLMGQATFPNDRIAAGFKLTSESGGVLNSTSAEATFIYRVPVAKSSKLSFGLSGVLNQMGIMRDRINAQNPDDPLLSSAKAGFWGDANFGVSLYETNRYYAGFGINNLMGGQTTWLVSNFTNRAARLYSLSGMYTFTVFHGDGKLEFTGVGLSYVTGKTAVNYDVTSRIIMKKSFWVGTGYTPNAIKVLFGLYFQNFTVGYTGGIGVGDITKFTYKMPRQEIFVRLEINNSKSSRTK
jgi:type IX secretion system PorP/SprF family membrane protein